MTNRKVFILVWSGIYMCTWPGTSRWCSCMYVTSLVKRRNEHHHSRSEVREEIADASLTKVELRNKRSCTESSNFEEWHQMIQQEMPARNNVHVRRPSIPPAKDLHVSCLKTQVFFFSSKDVHMLVCPKWTNYKANASKMTKAAATKKPRHVRHPSTFGQQIASSHAHFPSRNGMLSTKVLWNTGFVPNVPKPVWLPFVSTIVQKKATFPTSEENHWTSNDPTYITAFLCLQGRRNQIK